MIELLISTGLEILFKPEMVVEDKSRYRWISTVKKDPHGIKDIQGNLLVAPYIDPPVVGGYLYHKADFSPYYWDDTNCLHCDSNYKVSEYWEGNVFKFKDFPRDPLLKGLEQIIFNTCLVDVSLSNEELFCVNWSYTSINTVRVNNITQGDEVTYGPF